ncbi:MAG: pyridoxamine kinase [Eubacterium sp.]|nr:pyridoxamine kinase [Eubacterium sp.]
MKHIQKKIAMINDITGFGRCSIAVMAPIVSAMKIQAVVVPTAILSTHTQFPEYFFDDYTSKMPDYIQTYKNLNMDFDGIATGFLGSTEQVEIVIDFIKTFKKKDSMILVDPVMGDYGMIYKTYTPELCDKMKELVNYASILTPNLTELCTLLDISYGNGRFSRDQIGEMCDMLAKKGPKHIVVTGIQLNDNQIMNYIYTQGQTAKEIIVDRIGKDRSGTGDVISAVIAGMFMNGHTFYDSVKKATEYASKCIEYCEENNVPEHWGLSFEMYLNSLMED